MASPGGVLPAPAMGNAQLFTNENKNGLFRNAAVRVLRKGGLFPKCVLRSEVQSPVPGCLECDRAHEEPRGASSPGVRNSKGGGLGTRGCGHAVWRTGDREQQIGVLPQSSGEG